ncbi:MAG: sigma-70 family RNA polymerase sigma factor [Saprospiraceae bacterium]|nr:sigma-70 family RNA polymerase sigma factor [Saprospiraceae bacterium]
MRSTEDTILIEKTLSGDLNSFERIVRKYNSIVFTLALRILKNREEAEETAQDVFMKAFRSLRSFNSKSKFSTWIYRIAYNESVNRLRSQKKYSETNELNENLQIGFYDPRTEHDTEDEKKIILDSLLTLPETERIIITLYYYEDMPVKEIAEITGMTESNVKVRLFRSRQKLYDELKGKLEYESSKEYELKYR